MAKKRIQNLLKHVVCILLCLCVVLPFYMVLINSFKTKAEAENLIEEAADRAENPSFFKKLTGIFSSKYDKEGLLILKEEHFL